MLSLVHFTQLILLGSVFAHFLKQCIAVDTHFLRSTESVMSLLEFTFIVI